MKTCICICGNKKYRYSTNCAKCAYQKKRLRFKEQLSSENLEEFFWENVLKTSGVFNYVNGSLSECWIWTGTRLRTGYGKFKLRHSYAHRYSYTLHYGPIKDKYQICHHCDNPSCVRPSHLFQGTAKDNTQDRIRKGRRTDLGSTNPSAKLTEVKVLKIRKAAAQGTSYPKLGKQYGVTPSAICYIVKRKVWRHI